MGWASTTSGSEHRDQLDQQPRRLDPGHAAIGVLLALLILTAIAWHYLGRFLLLVAAVILLVRLWWWATNRFPDTMMVVNMIIAAACRGRR